MFSGTETLTCLSGRVFWGDVGSGAHCLLYKQENCLIQNTYIMNCQSDFLQLFLTDSLSHLAWEMCQMNMIQKKLLTSESLQHPHTQCQNH